MTKFSRLNLARRVMDHRILPDQHLIISQRPFTRNYFYAYQQKFYSLLINGYTVYLASFLLTMASVNLVYLTFKHHYSPDENPVSRFYNGKARRIEWAELYLDELAETPKYDRVYLSYSDEPVRINSEDKED